MPSRLESACLCRYSYHSSSEDLSGYRLVDDYETLAVRFCYVEHEESKTYGIVIRGSDNLSNWRDDTAMLVDSGALARLCEATQSALRYFEGRHGECSFGTGHSLGGKLLEFLPERISSISFNAYFNENRRNISSIRVHGDIAVTSFVAGKSHTDHWIGSPLGIIAHGDISYGVEKHSIDTVISILREHTPDFIDSAVKEIAHAAVGSLGGGAGFFVPPAVRRPVERAIEGATQVAVAPVVGPARAIAEGRVVEGIARASVATIVEPARALGKIFGLKW